VFKKPFFLKLGKIKLPFKKNAALGSDLANRQDADSSTRQDLDKKLVYSLNKKKLPNLKQLKYLPSILKPKERQFFRAAVVLFFSGLILLAATFYFRNYLPVPVAGGEYTEDRRPAVYQSPAFPNQ
jgi:hypothetical protein